jgi:PAS domain S-box-containing protein
MTRILLPLVASAGNDVPRFSLSEVPVPMVYATHRIIRDCNALFAALFGATREDIVDQSFSRLYPEIDDFVRTGKMWQTNLSGGRVYYDERIMMGLDGTRFWCRVNGRSRSLEAPFAEALYCFEPMQRPLTSATHVLTDRQRQVLTLVAQGKTNAMIATETGLSRRTIEAHRARLMQALGVANSAELVAWFLGDAARKLR